ncbi:MAG: S-layer homology domain-containing protein [Oscillospiraceae bacterium]|nr:S-layer homology domain-containing protein [Oscillospiraceae bacterium]
MEKTKSSKIMSFFLAIILILGIFVGFGLPVSAVGSDFIAKIDPPVSGSIAISTRDELEAIRDNLSGTYHLTADIDLSGTPWVPIGDNSTNKTDSRFTGTFDGQGYVIYNMSVTGNINRYAGLFGYTDGARIKNVGMEETLINTNSGGSTGGYSYAGGICGYNGGTISNCYNTGAISSFGEGGGICGYSTGSISNCYNIGDISVIPHLSGLYSSSDGYAGGICSRSSSSVNNCYNTGSVSVSERNHANSYAGGICGSGGTINNCYNTGAISSVSSNQNSYAGGICGDGSNPSNCYNTGAISATTTSSHIYDSTYAGGICGGYNNNPSYCYNTGAISSSFGTAGGICGRKGSPNFCYWNSESTQTVKGIARGSRDNPKKGVGDDTDPTTGLSTSQMKEQASFEEFDFKNVWTFKNGVNNGYPVLMTFYPTAPNIGIAAEWAREGITEAYNKGFIPDELQNDYKSIITRQEFCRMAVRWVEYATGKSIDVILSEKGLSRNPNAFTDTDNPDILAAFALGITSGTGNNEFTPLGQFTREQAATMIMNTCKAIGVIVSNSPSAGFDDMNNAAEWAVAGINFVRANGIMQGMGNNIFNPKGTYTRQESIITFNNIKLETLPKS